MTRSASVREENGTTLAIGKADCRMVPPSGAGFNFPEPKRSHADSSLRALTPATSAQQKCDLLIRHIGSYLSEANGARNEG